ncbi:cupin domain-containing protein [Actibacterium sp. MT2.3-13A]|uniref:cupin domain-containing protein n=1 Tax=Actibacterium sp. MT2.3-13A TaxID=2828332 RepID=UPI00201243E6|nr:cupin domain-containing protein [Actibacterium sp. MT2.3-13A]
MPTERARTYDVLGILMRFHAFPEEVQGKYCLVEAVVPPGRGAPPNHHAGETEAFFVLDGAIEFMVDGELRRAGAGTHVAIPDGAVHAFTSIGDRPARVLILNAPGRMHDAFFTGIGTVLPEETAAPPAPAGPPDLVHVLQVAEAAGMTILPPPG